MNFNILRSDRKLSSYTRYCLFRYNSEVTYPSITLSHGISNSSANSDGSTVSVTCDVGYRIAGQSSLTLSCTQSGQSSLTLSCTQSGQWSANNADRQRRSSLVFNYRVMLIIITFAFMQIECLPRVKYRLSRGKVI